MSFVYGFLILTLALGGFIFTYASYRKLVEQEEKERKKK